MSEVLHLVLTIVGALSAVTVVVLLVIRAVRSVLSLDASASMDYED